MIVFRILKIVAASCALFFLPACRPQVTSSRFFDLKGYLNKDAERLTKLNPDVEKTVDHNGVSETKTVKIADWKRELGMFIDADINKPAWKSSYEVHAEDNLLVYNNLDSSLFVRRMIIDKPGGHVRWILIYTKEKNFLYTTTTKLTYYPDSIYMIESDQRVRLSKKNHYKIQGRILNPSH